MKQISEIRVPCSTSNIGPGFDCIGLALQKYITTTLYIKTNNDGKNELPSLTLKYIKTKVHPTLQLSQNWTKVGENEIFETNDTDNRIIMAFNKCVEHVNGKRKLMQYEKIEMHIINDIPIGVGLGSSAAASITGIIAGNILCNSMLTRDQIYKLAYSIEGHPDNVTPSIMGGCTISMADIDFIKPTAAIFDNLDIGIIIPATKVSTEDARKALPSTYSRSEVVFTIQRCASLVALLGLPADEVLAKPVLFQQALADVVHQHFRADLMPGTPEVLKLNSTLKEDKHFFGTAISGAGPSVLLFYRKGSPSFSSVMKKLLESFEKVDKEILEVFELSVDKKGFQFESFPNN